MILMMLILMIASCWYCLILLVLLHHQDCRYSYHHHHDSDDNHHARHSPTALDWCTTTSPLPCSRERFGITTPGRDWSVRRRNKPRNTRFHQGVSIVQMEEVKEHEEEEEHDAVRNESTPSYCRKRRISAKDTT